MYALVVGRHRGMLQLLTTKLSGLISTETSQYNYGLSIYYVIELGREGQTEIYYVSTTLGRVGCKQNFYYLFTTVLTLMVFFLISIHPHQNVILHSLEIIIVQPFVQQKRIFLLTFSTCLLRCPQLLKFTQRKCINHIYCPQYCSG